MEPSGGMWSHPLFTLGTLFSLRNFSNPQVLYNLSSCMYSESLVTQPRWSHDLFFKKRLVNRGKLSTFNFKISVKIFFGYFSFISVIQIFPKLLNRGGATISILVLCSLKVAIIMMLREMPFKRITIFFFYQPSILYI